jgi:hypothetical protein
LTAGPDEPPKPPRLPKSEESFLGSEFLNPEKSLLAGLAVQFFFAASARARMAAMVAL